MDAKVNLARQFGRFHDYWSPRIVATVNDYDIKLVKVQGKFVWHQHQDTDELFLVIDGQLRIQLQNHDDVLLGPASCLWCRVECATVPPPTRRPACCSWSSRTPSTPVTPPGWAPSATGSADRSQEAQRRSPADWVRGAWTPGVDGTPLLGLAGANGNYPRANGYVAASQR